MIYTFTNKKEQLGRLDQDFYSAKDIEAEPMLYGASLIYAQENGGRITRNALQKVLPEVSKLILQHAALGSNYYKRPNQIR